MSLINANWSASSGMDAEPVSKKRKRNNDVPKTRRQRNHDNSDDESDGDDEEGKELLKAMIKSSLGGFPPHKEDQIKGKMNHIYFNDDINKRSCRKLISQIEEMNIKLGKLNSDYDLAETPKIYLHIDSFGGSIFAALGVIDTMRRSQFPIITIIEGASASAATLISVFGHERWMTKNAYMLIHQLSSVCWGKMTEIDDEYANLKVLMDHIYQIYEEKTKMKRSEIRNVLKKDLWWNSSLCLSKGLVDKII